jgi:hypothetical protein
MSNTSKPAAKVSMFPITAAIWRNQRDNRSFYSVTFERSYKDEQGAWQSTDSFGESDTLLLAKVADQAHSEILKLRAADRDTQQQGE